MAYNSNPYGESEQGYGGYDQSHELQSYPQQSSAPLSKNDFLNAISSLRQSLDKFEQDLDLLKRERQIALSESDGGQAARNLERMDAEIQASRQAIYSEIKRLTEDASHTTDSSKDLKTQQLAGQKNRFNAALHRNQRDENDYQKACREQVRRQILIVNPDVSEQELQQAVENMGDEGVFQRALLSNRTGQAASVLGNVRARHNELQRIEKELIELANMFQDLDSLVVQQEVAVQAAEANAEVTNKYTEEGNQHVGKGIQSARNRRKLKWWCLLICILIIIIAVAVGAGVACSNGLCGNKKN